MVLVVGGLAVFFYLRVPIKSWLADSEGLTVKKGDTEFHLKRSKPGITGGAASGTTEKAEESTLLPDAAGSNEEPSAALQYHRAVMARDAQQAESIHNAQVEAEVSAEDRQAMEILHLYNKFAHFGEPDAISQMERRCQSREADVNCFLWLALAYDKGGNKKRALEVSEKAVLDAKTEKEKAEATVFCSKYLHDLGEKDGAFSRVFDELARTNSDGARLIFYKHLESLYKSDGDELLRTAASEKILQMAPNAGDFRFDAAYSYDKLGYTALSLFHYRTNVGFHASHDMTLNNIGVLQENNGMRMRAIRNYEKSSKLGNSLAKANLAYMYMRDGFFDRAKELLDEARQCATVHANVGRAMAELDALQVQEEKVAEAFKSAAEWQHRFMLEYADAAVSRSTGSQPFAGQWRWSDGTEFTMAQLGRQVSASWKVKEDSQNLDGEATNLSIAATAGTSASSAAFVSRSKKIVGYMTEDRSLIRLMSVDGPITTSILECRRVGQGVQLELETSQA